MGGRTMVCDRRRQPNPGQFRLELRHPGTGRTAQLTARLYTGNPNAGPVTGSDNYEIRDMVTLTKGKHNLSLGGEFSLDKTISCQSE